MAIVGTVDQWTPPADVEAARDAGITVVAYEGADHGFVHDDTRPGIARRMPRTPGARIAFLSD
jgi:hypothetical protein